MNVSDGSGEQGVNLKVNGNLNIDSGNTQAIDAGGAVPLNANSILYVQATGNVQVNAGTGANNYGSIAVPNTTDGLGFPSAAINGNAPTATSYVTDYMPTVYFMRSVPTAAYGEELLPSDAFTNDNGQLQKMQTFLNLY
ncbi:hypothetical protein [Acidithiobacillus sulfuriphilus]|uniref:Uncharacterized protein n=2 Tax=Acidithiobacillus sulfuriphilus TaxID=1867749 RepID=A0A3M8QZ89_9PROT|nr:hypothetical protein [Acidithiobacillus sulfuriphilus]RNF61638.1 hypothetical protein EC580_08095 [Acidithiobacillus sulfuriphilus]